MGVAALWWAWVWATCLNKEGRGWRSGAAPSDPLKPCFNFSWGFVGWPEITILQEADGLYTEILCVTKMSLEPCSRSECWNHCCGFQIRRRRDWNTGSVPVSGLLSARQWLCCCHSNKIKQNKIYYILWFTLTQHPHYCINSHFYTISAANSGCVPNILTPKKVYSVVKYKIFLCFPANGAVQNRRKRNQDEGVL